jgi:hypothetical protein
MIVISIEPFSMKNESEYFTWIKKQFSRDFLRKFDKLKKHSRFPLSTKQVNILVKKFGLNK